MNGSHLSQQARGAVEACPVPARARGHSAFGPPHLLTAILARWDDDRAGGPALLRACGLSVGQLPDPTETVLRAYDQSESGNPETAAATEATADTAASRAARAAGSDPRPSPAMRLTLDHALRFATEAGDGYVGTEHLVLAMLWRDNPTELRRHGLTYGIAAERMAALPRVESLAPVGTIEPLESASAPTPAAAELEELARQQAAQHPIGGRITTMHQLLALLMSGAARQVMEDLGLSYQMVVERLEAAGAGVVEADSHRSKELPLEGWKQFIVTVDEWDRIHGRMRAVLGGERLLEQGVRLAMNPVGDGARVSVHAGRSGLTEAAVLARLLGDAAT